MDCWKELRSTVARLHPYDVPELLALPVGAGLPAYLDWIAEQTGEERT
jgi:periplasmic divalent cation tolerance protein